jgi:hypothetical protein
MCGDQVFDRPTLKLRRIGAFEHSAPGGVGVNHEAGCTGNDRQTFRGGLDSSHKQCRIGDPGLFGRSWAIALIIFNSDFKKIPSPIPGTRLDLLRGLSSNPQQTKALATRHDSGKDQMGAGTVSIGLSPPESGNLLRQVSPLVVLSISGSLDVCGQTAKGSGHTRL